MRARWYSIGQLGDSVCLFVCLFWWSSFNEQFILIDKWSLSCTMRRLSEWYYRSGGSLVSVKFLRILSRCNECEMGYLRHQAYVAIELSVWGHMSWYFSQVIDKYNICLYCWFLWFKRISWLLRFQWPYIYLHFFAVYNLRVDKYTHHLQHKCVLASKFYCNWLWHQTALRHLGHNLGAWTTRRGDSWYLLMQETTFTIWTLDMSKSI